MGKWKGLGTPGNLALYDLSNDMGEEHNLAAQHPEIVKKLNEYLATAYTQPRSQKDDGKYTGRTPKMVKLGILLLALIALLLVVLFGRGFLRRQKEGKPETQDDENLMSTSAKVTKPPISKRR